MTHHHQSLQSLQLLVQELMNCGLLAVQLARELEQRVLSLEEELRQNLDSPEAAFEASAASANLPDAAATSTHQANPSTPIPAALPINRAAKRSGSEARHTSRPMVPAQCRACGREVLRRPDSIALFDPEGTEHAVTCAMRRIVCRDSVSRDKAKRDNASRDLTAAAQ